MATSEIPGAGLPVHLFRLLSDAVDLLRDLLVDIDPDDHRRGQVEQILYEIEEVIQ